MPTTARQMTGQVQEGEARAATKKTAREQYSGFLTGNVDVGIGYSDVGISEMAAGILDSSHFGHLQKKHVEFS